jgi:transcriptional regulator with XRE-family HTH domain
MSPNRVPQDLDPERVRVGATLRAFREKSGIRVDQAASALRPPRSRSYLANIEAGRKPLPTVMLAQLAALYGVPEVAIRIPGLLDEESAA